MAEHSRVLVVSYIFAPVGGVATERCRKFVKYLRDFGWDPLILTQDLDETLRIRPVEIDHSTLDELPSDLEISRVYGPVFSAPVTARPSVATTPPIGGSLSSTPPLRWLRSLGSLLLSPDSFVAWIFPALLRGRRLIRERDCRVIFATAPAFTAFPLAALLSVVGRRPLVLDYRDPWGENGALFGDRRWKQRLNRLMERLCLRRSSRVVFATEGFRDLYARRHPDLAERFEVIQNGFDREPVAAKKPRGEREPLRIGYAGKMFGDQYPMEPFFRALASFVEERGRDLLRVEMAGQIDPENEALLAELGLGDVVELRGFQPREEVEQLQERSDVLLLVIGDMHPFFHGLESAKLFEYMPLARPILGLVPEGGAAWQLISRHQIGPLAPPSDVVRIRRVLDELVGRSASGPAVAPRQFHRRNLTGRLAGILDEVSRP